MCGALRRFAYMVRAFLLTSSSVHQLSYGAFASTGSFGLPIIGTVPDVLRLGFAEFTAECFRRFGPIYHLEGDLVFVGDPDVARQVIKATNSRPNLWTLGATKRMRLWSEAGIFVANGKGHPTAARPFMSGQWFVTVVAVLWGGSKRFRQRKLL